MVSEEVSGAVSILPQMNAGGTADPAEAVWPYSAFHNKTIITAQKTAARSWAARDAMPQSNGGNGQGLAYAHPARFQARICGHERFQFYPVLLGNRHRGFAG